MNHCTCGLRPCICHLDPEPVAVDLNEEKAAATPQRETAPTRNSLWKRLRAAVFPLLFLAILIFACQRDLEYRRALIALDSKDQEIQRLNDYSAQRQSSYDRALVQVDQLSKWKSQSIGLLVLSQQNLESCAIELNRTAHIINALKARTP